MKNYDLSIVIPARNEMFLAKTISDIIKNKKGNTQIIIGLDGYWPYPQVEDHEDIIIYYTPKPIGQRAMTNQCVRLSQAKYIMKVDAHCAFDEGFDQKIVEDMKYNYTMIPTMYNLHAFDWVCPDGHRRYQGPSGPCKKCGKETTMDIVWEKRDSRKSTAYRFDKTLHFQYWGEYKKEQAKQGNIADTMSAQGSCFIISRDRYWELNICDEKHGGWGQQGTEIACATWLSGGRLVTNMRTWYAHMFRTQGGDFGFPYKITHKEQESAREYSRDLWLNNKHPKQIHNIEWLVEKFKPVPDWHFKKEEKKKLTKGIVYYTDNELDPAIMEACQKQLKKCMKEKHIVSVSLKPINFGVYNIVMKDKNRGYLTMAEQILAGLEESTADIIFLCEHDVYYHPKHFDFIPSKKDVYYYNTNVWRLRYSDGLSLYCDGLQQLSGLVAYRETLVEHFKKRVERIKKEGYSTKMGFEPGTHTRPERIDDLMAENYHAEKPNIDIRHDSNLTPSRWEKDEFRNKKYTSGWQKTYNIPSYGSTKKWIKETF